MPSIFAHKCIEKFNDILTRLTYNELLFHGTVHSLHALHNQDVLDFSLIHGGISSIIPIEPQTSL